MGARTIRRAAFAFVMLIMLSALGMRGPNPRAAEVGATPLYLPVIRRDGPTATPTATTSATATSTATATATATSTATPTATTSATATATPTEQPTVGCFPHSGTYPIALHESLLDANGFVPPTEPNELPYYVSYSDEIYQNKTQRRIYLVDGTNISAGFTFLRWRADPLSGNTSAFTSAMSGTGTLSQGFDEAPWPAGDVGIPKPDSYPWFPHQFNTGDWTYGTSGVTLGAAVRAALDQHIVDRTLMTLPLYDASVGVGANTSVHVAKPGAFLLRGYGTASGGRLYFDLVYIDEPALGSCGG
ncbi:MAG TPA: hypothetical protein VFX76_20325 [Roseiflexaceae bacterium]|nr:hypothetical protein [Roseiflexaceae bacterium]